MLCCWNTERADSSYATRRVRVLVGRRSHEEDKTKARIWVDRHGDGDASKPKTGQEIRDRAHTVERPRHFDRPPVQSVGKGIGSLGCQSLIQFKSDVASK
jgi:hypothetical protein